MKAQVILTNWVSLMEMMSLKEMTLQVATMMLKIVKMVSSVVWYHILKLHPSRSIISGPDMGNCHDNFYGNYVLIIPCTIVCTYAPAVVTPHIGL